MDKRRSRFTFTVHSKKINFNYEVFTLNNSHYFLFLVKMKRGQVKIHVLF